MRLVRGLQQGKHETPSGLRDDAGGDRRGIAFALWSGSLWVALGVLISGFVLAFVVSMAWLWAPRSGINSKRKPSSDSLPDVL